MGFQKSEPVTHNLPTSQSLVLTAWEAVQDQITARAVVVRDDSPNALKTVYNPETGVRRIFVRESRATEDEILMRRRLAARRVSPF